MALLMMATDSSRVPSFSMVACPPRLKRRTLWPVLPKGRSGMGGGPAAEGTSDAAAPGTFPPSTKPAVPAPVTFMKSRRENLLSDIIRPPEEKKLFGLERNRRRPI